MTQKDTNGNLKPVSYESKFADANMSVNPFGQNAAAEIAYKKTERVVLATHLVTNFVPKNECVREAVREVAQSLLPKVLELREGLRSGGQERIPEICARIRNILSLLDVIHASGYISDMNLEVLKFAYADLARFLETSERGNAAESFELHEDFFTPTPNASQGQKDKGQKKDIKDISVKDNIKDINTGAKKTNTKGHRPQSVRSKRKVKSRRIAILDVITKKSPVHIKDIANEITDCSEKTIQRELVALVRDNVVKKEGSKRWTTYSLVV